MGLAQEVTDWCVDSLPSLSDHRNISFTLKFKVRSCSEKVTKMGRNYHKADWAKFKEIVNTGCMTEIAEQRVWTPRHIEAACQKWYSPVLRAFNTVCPSTKIKVRDDCYWWDDDCEKAKKEVHGAEKHAHKNANNKQKPNGQDWAEFKRAGRAYKRTIWKAKENKWQEYVS
jgi:hypothetical protein